MAVVTSLTTGIAGIVFGFAIAAPPGPMNAIIAEESVLRGWSAGFRAGLGAMSADACFLVLALLGAVAFVEAYPAVRTVLIGIGGMLMWYFAYGAARDASASTPITSGFDTRHGATANKSGDEPNADAGSTAAPGTGFRKAFVLAITNPFQIAFWLTVGLSLLEPGRLDVLEELPYLGDALAGRFVVATGSPLVLIGFFGGIALWITGFPAILVAARNRSAAVAPTVAYLSAAVLAVFGTAFVLDAVRRLHGAV